VQHLSLMAIAVCLSALLLDMAADRLRRMGLKTELVLASTLMASMAAQAGLLFGWFIPSYLLWAVIAAAGAATVLSFAILTEYFPKEMSGRANAALNLLHIGGAFVLQSATGLIIEQWPAASGSYPVDAHQMAMAASLFLQLAAFAWFALSRQSQPVPTMQGVVRRAVTNRRPQPASASIGYATALWGEQSGIARRQASGWRLAAAASAALCVVLATVLASMIGHANLAAHIVEVDRSIVTAGGSTMRDATTATAAEAAGTSGLALLREVPPLLSVHRSAVHWTLNGLSASSLQSSLGQAPRQSPNSQREQN